jgi:transposase
MNTIAQIYVGVDVAKNFLDIYLQPVGKAFRVTNDAHGIRKLIKELSKYTVEQIVCEASGGYEQLMFKKLRDKNHNVWLVDPKRIRAFIISEGINAKTDKIDAQMIALFASQKQLKYKPIVPSPEEEHLSALANRRDDLVKMIVKEKNRLGHPQYTHCKAIVAEHIEFMERQVKRLDAAIKQLINNNDDLNNKAKIIESVPGMGKVSTSMLLAQLPELGAIDDKQVASIIGVAPFIRQSGNSKGTAAIKGGRSSLRSVIYMAANVAIRYNPVLKAFYERLRKAGKKFKVALIAVMRKLITILNTMVKKNEQWCPM